MNIIFDIDGTIADCRHRRHFVNDGNNDWDSFYHAMADDKPIKPIISLYHHLLPRVTKIKFITGRPESYRNQTQEWLIHRGIIIDNEDLRMRATTDYRPDWQIKEHILMKLKDINWWPHLVIDDNQLVVDMWRRNGIICLQNSMKEMPI